MSDKVVKKRKKTIQITKQQLVDTILSVVQPGVLVEDIEKVSLGQDDGSFLQVDLVQQAVAPAMFVDSLHFTKEKLISALISSHDSTLTASDIEDFKVNEMDSTKIDVVFGRVKITEFGGGQ